MSVQVEMLEKNMAKLTVDVPAEAFAKAIAAAYKKNRGQFAIPGFRKGKVPQTIIEKMYGPAVFYEEAANSVIPDAYEAAVKESGLDVVSRPEVDVEQIEKGKDFIFTAMVAVKPEVTLGQYKGVEVTRTVVEVTDAEVDSRISAEQEKNSRDVTVERPAEKGDTVVIDYAGTVDGEAFEGGSAENHRLELGSNSFIPGFEDQLVGASAGEDVEVKVTFPEDYHAKELAGKDAVFACRVHEVQAKELPELDDEFAQDVSEFDTFEEYREDVRKQILTGKEKAAESEKREKAVAKAIENAQMEIPDAMVETEAAGMADDYARQLSMQGLSMDLYYQYTGMDQQGFIDQMKPQALANIKNRLVLEKVAAEEDIQVTEEEMESEMQRMADAYQMELDRVKELINDVTKDQMRQDLQMRKAADMIAEAAVEVDAPEPAPEEEA